MNDTVYIVSGYMRTGTSMMMKALEAGGMEAVYRESRDTMRKQYADDLYDPNEGGLYELERKDYQEPGFPVKYRGKLIKLLNAGTARMDVMPHIKVAYMERDYEEVRQSYTAFFNQPFTFTREMFDENNHRSIALLKNRRDTDVVTLWYPDVIAHPHDAFAKLKEAGWPIDVKQCMDIVKPDLYRFRKDRLVEGII